MDKRKRFAGGFITREMIADTMRRVQIGQKITLMEKHNEYIWEQEGHVVKKYPHFCRLEIAQNGYRYSRCIKWQDLIWVV